MKGLTVSVYREADGSDFTLGGISGKHNTLTVIGTIDRHDRKAMDIFELPEGSQVSEASEECPGVFVMREFARGADKPWNMFVVPAPCGPEQDIYAITDLRSVIGLSFGGNFVSTSDSRWRELTGVDALRVHDRRE
jgi:hypothetical protein